ncbi:uncharacterized protein LOC125561824 [Nematostella vectensis]|uniref:uncharacterized protein LOC125561824 n=1 Tax=Nematostella vectensis TaxID=45351 RepID=UPI0020775F01|nr:uncharacterized protein LOC125561824 [Nematostella vectensis]
MKAYKSLEAYNFFVSGWVNSILTKKVTSSTRILVTGRINHSQRSRATPLKSWFLAEKSGEVIVAHCNCMAGLSEACSHIGALLFAVQAGARMLSSTTCTQEKGKWIMPSYVKEIPYMPVSEMDLTSAKRLRKQIDEPETVKLTSIKQRSDIEMPSVEERTDFYNELSGHCKSAILSLIPTHNTLYMPHEVNQDLPKTVIEQIQLKYSTYKIFDAIQQIDEVFECLTVSDKEAEAIESTTRDQSDSKLWFSQRAARITASKFKACCSTNPEFPSRSLVKVICYPEAHKFSSAATKWGIDNECKARESYSFAIASDHLNLSAADCGFYINVKWPFLGASPDGLVMCDCCGIGLCEIKCPYKHRNTTIAESLNDKGFCLHMTERGSIQLNTNHQYYHQVQCQLFGTDTAYCDFVVWTEEDLFCQRILPDEEFWNTNLPKAISFFKKGLLPEVLKSICCEPSELAQDSDEDGPWCFCQEDIEESMLVRCDKTNCSIKWFHMDCVGLSIVPNGEWICTYCLELR